VIHAQGSTSIAILIAESVTGPHVFPHGSRLVHARLVLLGSHRLAFGSRSARVAFAHKAHLPVASTRPEQQEAARVPNGPISAAAPNGWHSAQWPSVLVEQYVPMQQSALPMAHGIVALLHAAVQVLLLAHALLQHSEDVVHVLVFGSFGGRHGGAVSAASALASPGSSTCVSAVLPSALALASEPEASIPLAVASSPASTGSAGANGSVEHATTTIADAPHAILPSARVTPEPASPMNAAYRELRARSALSRTAMFSHTKSSRAVR
jgi:hypothetical protein